MVLSTTGPQGPESALVAFVETDELEIIFETFVDSRKYRNLHIHSRVSTVIGWASESYVTIQYQGNALELIGEDVLKARELFRAKITPCTEQYLSDTRVRFFKIKPSWIRYSDYDQSPPLIEEWHADLS